MKEYIKKIEALVKEKLKEKPKETKKQIDKGFMARPDKDTDEPKERDISMDLVEQVAEQVAFVRRKRMELKKNV